MIWGAMPYIMAKAILNRFRKLLVELINWSENLKSWTEAHILSLLFKINEVKNVDRGSSTSTA